MNKWLTGEWVVDKTTRQPRRVIHYWATVLWFTVGLVVWIVLRDALVVCRVHVALRDLGHPPRWLGRRNTGGARGRTTPRTDRGSPGSAEVDTADSLAQAEPY